MYADLIFWTNDRSLFEKYFWFIWICLWFSKISGLIRFSKMYYGQCPSKTVRYTNLFGGRGPKQISKRIGFSGSEFGKFSKFQKVEIWKNIMFKDDPIICLVFLIGFLVVKRRCKGPLRVPKKSRFWKFPESSKKYCNMTGDLH